MIAAVTPPSTLAEFALDEAMHPFRRLCLLATLVTLSASGVAAMTPAATPYGSWPSPIDAATLAGAAIGMSDLQVHGGALFWRETRPAEGGREVLMRLEPGGEAQQLTPPGFSVRTRVHEYGGASYAVLDDAIVFSNFDDQRLYLQRGHAAPVAITPSGYRYADCRPHPLAAMRLVCVREDHTDATRAANGEERNEIVAVDVPQAADAAPDAGRVLVGGSDFVAYPRISPDGRRLAWLWWNHPQMPWDSARLSVAGLTGDVVGPATVIGGAEAQSALEPQWRADGTLYFIDDPLGWWNLHAWQHGEVRAIAPMAREFGGPLWAHGASTYALLGDGRAAVRSSLAGIDALGVLHLDSGALRNFDLPYVAFSDVQRLDERHVVAFASSETEHAALIVVDLADGTHRVLHRATPSSLDPAWIARAEPIEFPTTAGPSGEARSAHAFCYPPTNPGHVGPADEKPPLLVLAHGGPTSVTKPGLALARQFWTSRGFAVVDVNYGGSTTFGRAYRTRLNGQWGVVDLQDAVAAVEHLIALGRADPRRIAVRGGSAGGYLVLAALAFTDRFSVGANYYGVSDIKALSATSHKFERNYDVSLVGPPDEALYRERSPLYHLDRLTRPLITFQGADDRIVTADQSRRIFEALKARGVPTAYLEFEGEQHGFRRAGNIILAQQAELYFYGTVLGFTPAEALPGVEIHNLPER
jgi:dipeptidyl aminopeptidase/acylaminoacyl peptidase